MFRISSKAFNTAKMCLSRNPYPTKVILHLTQPILKQKFYSNDSKRPPPKFMPLKRGGVVRNFDPITRPTTQKPQPVTQKSQPPTKPQPQPPMTRPITPPASPVTLPTTPPAPPVTRPAPQIKPPPKPEPITLNYTKKLEDMAKIQSYQASIVQKSASSIKTISNEEEEEEVAHVKKAAPLAIEPPKNPIFEKPDIQMLTNVLEKETGSGDEKSKRGWRGEFAAKAMRYGVIFVAVSGSCVLMYVFYCFGQPRVGADGKVIPDEFSELPGVQQYLLRAVAEMNYYNNLIKEPSRDKLLPDPLPSLYQPPYTLVLEFTDLLVHAEWTYNTGWRFKKRPGLDHFLETLYGRYEVVVYTAEMGMTVFPLLEVLDKKGLIAYRLVRDATHFVDGHHVKDLDKLNRDLKKIIVVDWNPESTKMHEGNLFKIPRWNGNDDDTTLFDLTSFLMTIYEWEVEDIRNVLANYKSYADPLANFKERQKQVLGN